MFIMMFHVIKHISGARFGHHLQWHTRRPSMYLGHPCHHNFDLLPTSLCFLHCEPVTEFIVEISNMHSKSYDHNKVNGILVIITK